MLGLDIASSLSEGKWRTANLLGCVATVMVKWAPELNRHCSLLDIPNYGSLYHTTNLGVPQKNHMGCRSSYTVAFLDSLQPGLLCVRVTGTAGV